MTQMTGLNLLFQKKCLYKKRNLFIKNSIVSESRQNYVYSSEPLFAAFIYPTPDFPFLLSHTFPSIPFAIFFIEQLDSLKNWSRNFCKNSVNALGIFMVNSSGEIRSILSFLFHFLLIPFLKWFRGEMDVSSRFTRTIKEQKQTKQNILFFFYFFTFLYFLKGQFCERGKKIQEINFHVSIYKTHDLLNNSRTRICSSNTKIRL